MATIPSLALLPSGYKASKVYSVLPTDGSGDFDFTRSGNATRVNSEGLIELVSTNVPRLNYPLIDGIVSGCPSLLLEPQRQNVCLWSEQVDNAGWTKNNSPTITTNIATAPDGYGGADGIQSVTGGSYRTINQNFSVSANSTITGSVFIKKETSETAFGGLGIIFQGGTTKTCYTIFNAVTGTGLISGSSLTGTIKVDDYGNYWRLQVTTTDNGSNTTLNFSYYATLSADGVILNTSAGSVRTVWGFQLEIGAAYATSYIQTSGTTATRSAETCNGAGDVNTFNDSEGVLMVEISALANDLTDRSLSLSSGYYNNRIEIRYNDSSNGIRVFGIVGGAFQFDSSSSLSLPNITNQSKLAFKYKENNFALWVNGFEIYSDLFGSIFSEGVLNEIKFSDAQGAEPFYGNTKQIQYYDSALNDSELETLTSWVSFTDMAIGQLYSVE